MNLPKPAVLSSCQFGQPSALQPMGFLRRVSYASFLVVQTYSLAQTTSEVEDADPFDDEFGLVVTLTLKGDDVTYDAKLFVACEPSNKVGPVLLGGILPTKHEGDSTLDSYWRVDDHPTVTLRARVLGYQNLGYGRFLVHSSEVRVADPAQSVALLDPTQLRLRVGTLWPQILAGSKLVGRLGDSRNRFVTFDLLAVREDLRVFSDRCSATQHEWRQARSTTAELSGESR